MLRELFVPHFVVLLKVGMVEDNDIVFASIEKILVSWRHFAGCPNVCYFVSLRTGVCYVVDISSKVPKASV